MVLKVLFLDRISSIGYLLEIHILRSFEHESLTFISLSVCECLCVSVLSEELSKNNSREFKSDIPCVATYEDDI